MSRRPPVTSEKLTLVLRVKKLASFSKGSGWRNHDNVDNHKWDIAVIFS